MFRFAIERPIILTVGILILTLFGVLAIFQVPIQMIPDLDARIISVSTTWPGASPQDVEKEILVEQERYLSRIPGLERMVSTANTGTAEIELEFPFSVGIEEALLNVNNALSQVPSYPENVDQPSIRAEAFSSNSFMYFRLMPVSGDFTEETILELRDWAEEYVQTPMERVAGVSSVDMRGGAARQVQVSVDPVKLAERGIRLTDVRAAIRARNRDVSGGDLDSGKRRYLLRTIGRFENVEALENLVIAERDGSFIRLRDLGHAELGFAEVRNYAYSEGKPILAFAVNRQIGSNVITIKRDMLAIVAKLNAGILKERGLQLLRTADDVVYVTEAIAVVQRNLAIGAGLAILVLFLFLRSAPATLIGAIGIPICTVAAFLGLLIAGRTINVISLAGVAFAIGMTLDNNIVVLENIYRHLNMGKQRLQAALEGVREVWPAVLASTLTTVAVFLPVIFIEEEAGQLYSEIAIAISGSILMSMIVAIALVPAAAGYPIQQPFDMITMLGFLVLIGTVVNNPILIVERAVTNLREQGMTVLDAVTEAVRVRLRPIMMSMVTTVAGLSPLVFNPGAGTELYRGLGAIVLFGLLFSTLVTLTFMPALLKLVLSVVKPVERPRIDGQETGASPAIIS